MIGDTDGKVYVVCPDTADLVDSVKSMGEKVGIIESDVDHNIIYSHGSNIAVVNRNLEPLLQFKIDAEKFGAIIFLRPMHNLILVGTTSSTFLLLDSLDGQIKNSFKPKGWTVSGSISFLRSEKTSVRNLGGTEAGELMSFDVN